MKSPKVGDVVFLNDEVVGTVKSVLGYYMILESGQRILWRDAHGYSDYVWS